MNEMCLNLLGTGSKDDEGKQFSLEVLDFMRDKIADFQEETEIYITSRRRQPRAVRPRLAKIDVENLERILSARKYKWVCPILYKLLPSSVSEMKIFFRDLIKKNFKKSSQEERSSTYTPEQYEWNMATYH